MLYWLRKTMFCAKYCYGINISCRGVLRHISCLKIFILASNKNIILYLEEHLILADLNHRLFHFIFTINFYLQPRLKLLKCDNLSKDGVNALTSTHSSRCNFQKGGGSLGLGWAVFVSHNLCLFLAQTEDVFLKLNGNFFYERNLS